MLKDFSNPLESIREKKIADAARQLGYFFKNLTKKFCNSLSMEEERNFALESKKKLAAELKAKRLRLNAKTRCGYLTF